MVTNKQEYMKQYWLKHKDKYRDKARVYYQNHKRKMLMQANNIGNSICLCGCGQPINCRYGYLPGHSMYDTY